MFRGTYSVNINLEKDREQLTRRRLEEEGFKVDDRYEVIDYFRAIGQIIPRKPREIFYSKEFNCPEECTGDLKFIERVIANGGSLKPFMSRKLLKDIKRNDPLLNDWNIHHFHLSSELQIKNGKYTGLVKSSDWLLMTFINDDSVYFINIYPHGDKYIWTRKDMVEIISRNWPKLIEKFKLNEIEGLGENISEEEYATLRKSNALSLIQLEEGSVFGFIGGGYASDGTSITAVRHYDYCIDFLGNAQKTIEETKMGILRGISDSCDQYSKETFDIQMIKIIINDKIILLEKNRMVFVEIDFKAGKIRFRNAEDLKKRSALSTRIESKLIY